MPFTGAQWEEVRRLHERHPIAAKIRGQVIAHADRAMAQEWWDDFPEGDQERWKGGPTRMEGSKFYAGVGRGLEAVAFAYKLTGDETGITNSFGPEEAWNEGMSYGGWKLATLLDTALTFQFTAPDLHFERNPYWRRIGDFFSRLSPLGVQFCSFGNYGYSMNYLRMHNANFRKLAFLTEGLPLTPLTWTVGRDLVTPHPLGGCNMGSTAADGVVDHKGQVFNYPGLFVADGSIVPKAIGLNPSRTIAALAEHIAAQLVAEL